MSDKARTYWERAAKIYDISLWVTVRAMPKVLEELKGEFVGGERVLEVAAGTGMATEVMAPRVGEVVAVDYASAMVEKLKTRVQKAKLTNVHCQQADIYALPFEAESFDAVVAGNVLHLLPNLPKAYEALLRVLKPQGRLFAPTVCPNQTLGGRMLARLLKLTGLPIQRCFDVASFRASMEEAGLRVTKEKVFSGLMPLGYCVGTRTCP
ncbi:MAG: class I SAM-dependent methyltransferase [Cystobacterineae bacterium]|nr:class I SAM-dependent methyltransferase [Cystobacterineae bacterium]MCL2258864.1 class I SAM-dependent methyltransferase [Cystobacterineae bacterium]